MTQDRFTRNTVLFICIGISYRHVPLFILEKQVCTEYFLTDEDKLKYIFGELEYTFPSIYPKNIVSENIIFHIRFTKDPPQVSIKINKFFYKIIRKLFYYIATVFNFYLDIWYPIVIAKRSCHRVKKFNKFKLVHAYSL